MSLILDALKRSQQERDSVNDIPGIETQHPIDPLGPVDSWRRYFPWVALVLAVAIIVWLLIDGKTKTDAPAVVMLPETEELAPKTASAAVSPEKTVVQLIEQPIAELPVAEAIQPKRTIEVAEPDTEAAEVEGLYATKAQEKPVTQEKPQDVVADQPAVTEQVVDIEEMIALAKVEAENASLAEHAAPFLSELSQQLKDQIPTVYYSQHDFSSGSSQSSVTLNGEKYQTGSSLGSTGLKVDEILSASVVLNYKGTQFRLKALNSWINL